MIAFLLSNWQIIAAAAAPLLLAAQQFFARRRAHEAGRQDERTRQREESDTARRETEARIAANKQTIDTAISARRERLKRLGLISEGEK